LLAPLSGEPFISWGEEEGREAGRGWIRVKANLSMNEGESRLRYSVPSSFQSLIPLDEEPTTLLLLERGGSWNHYLLIASTGWRVRRNGVGMRGSEKTK